MKIPTPHELGLPEKYDKWRPAQEAAFEKMMTGQKRIDALAIPTGAGKTSLEVGYALYTKQPTCIVTENRGLQDQAEIEFGQCGLVSLKGRANYPCDLRPNYTCEDGYAASCPFRNTPACPSSQAEMRAAVSPLVVTNYAKWTAARKFGTGMSHFKQVILDEADKSFEALAKVMQVLLHHKEIEETLGLNFPHEGREDLTVWKAWAMASKSRVESELKKAKRSMEMHNPRPAVVRHYLHMRNLSRRISTLATARPQDWIVDEFREKGGGFQFDPVRPGRYTEPALLFKIPRVIMVSATLRPKLLFMLGQGKDNYDFTEYDSDFDPNRCPIYLTNTMQVDKNALSLHMIWLLLDQFAGRRQDRKGIVHTISFPRQGEVIQSSRFAESMLINTKGQATGPVIDEFRDSLKGTILVSPSVAAGYDFAYTDAEWQFICKIPFLDTRQKIVKARQDVDKEYAPYIAMQKLVQTCGRIMRGASDQGESLLPDAHAEWFIPRYKHLAPKSFLARLRRVSTLPQPPPALVG